MGSSEIDRYLEGVDEPFRGALEGLRRVILGVVPHAEQGISYQVPAFRVDGAVVAGFAAFKKHLSYLPFSGSVLHTLRREIKGRDHTKSSLHFTPDDPLPDALIEQLVRCRLEEIRTRGH